MEQKNRKNKLAAKRDIFVIWIHVKPYVAKYLLRNYRLYEPGWDALVDISKDKELSTFVDNSLIKPCRWRDTMIKPKEGRSRIAIEISKDKFYRYGWALTATDENRLNSMLENRCKNIAKIFLSTQYMWSGNLSKCIKLLYKTFGWTEDDWDIENIRKIWNRDRVMPKKEIFNLIYQEKTRFVLDKLAENRQITEQGKNAYESNIL